jgi:hypothetical protein
MQRSSLDYFYGETGLCAVEIREHPEKPTRYETSYLEFGRLLP